MKRKKSLNGLSINKQTIANLSQAEMDAPRGGTDIPVKTVDWTVCLTNCYNCPTMMPSKCPEQCSGGSEGASLCVELCTTNVYTACYC